MPDKQGTHSQASYIAPDFGEPAKRLAWTRFLSGIENRIVCVVELVVPTPDAKSASVQLEKHGWVLQETEELQPADARTHIGDAMIRGRLSRLFFKQVRTEPLTGETNQRIHDDIVVALGHEGIRALSMIVVHRPPRAVALKKFEPDPDSISTLDDVSDPVVYQVARTSVFAQNAAQDKVWGDYTARNGLPESDLQAPVKMSRKRLILTGVYLTALTLCVLTGVLIAPQVARYDYLELGDTDFWWVNMIFWVSVGLLCLCILALVCFVFVPPTKAMRTRSTVASRYELLMSTTSKRLAGQISPGLVEFRNTVVSTLVASILFPVGALAGVAIRKLDDLWIAGIICAALFAASGLWGALRRIVGPARRWLRIGAAVPAFLISVHVYARATQEHFWASLGVPTFTLIPTTEQLISSNIRVVAITMLIGAGALLFWILFRAHLSPPMSWLVNLLLVSIPALSLATGYDRAAYSAYWTLTVPSYESRWLDNSRVCLQTIDSSYEIEIEQFDRLSVVDAVTARRVGLADGRLYYLVPRNPSQESPAMFGLVSLPVNVVIERQPIGSGGTCR